MGDRIVVGDRYQDARACDEYWVVTEVRGEIIELEKLGAAGVTRHQSAEKLNDPNRYARR